MHYTIYKITNLLNSKIYIGCHSTENLMDDYMGSGKAIKSAIKKYGVRNFRKEILYVFPTKEEAYLKEKEIVNAQFIVDENTYNIRLGGDGGWDHTYKDTKRINAVKEAFVNGHNKGWQQSKEVRSRIGRSSFKGKYHTIESKKLIGEASALSKSEINKRFLEYSEIEKTWGWITKLAKNWGITNTQVKRFVKKHNWAVS